MGASPARLVIALSVAAALAIFVVYTALAGNGVANLTPSTVAGHTATSRSSARSSAGRRATRTRRRPALPAQGHRPRDAGARPGRVPRQPCPTCSRPGRDLVVEGTLRERGLRREAGLADHEVPVDSTRRRSPRTRSRWPRSGAPRSSSPSASSLYALVAGSYAAWKRRRRLALSAQNALLAAFPVDARRGRSSCSSRSAAATSPSSTSGSTRATSCRSATRCPRSGAARRARSCSGCSSSPATRRSPSGSTAARAISSPGRCPSSGSSPSSSPSCSASSRARSASQPAPADGDGMVPSLQNPYMLAHPPLLYLGYVGLTVPFAFAMGALLSRPHGRALDRRDAPLDARRLDVPRRRPAARRALGVRRDRLGRLLRLGSGRERGAHAVARGDRVPPLGDDPGEARDAEGLEHGARRARVQPLALRHVPHALGRDQLDPLVLAEPDRRLVPRLPRA